MNDHLKKYLDGHPAHRAEQGNRRWRFARNAKELQESVDRTEAIMREQRRKKKSLQS